MPANILDDAEKERIRYHTGYIETSFAAAYQLGIPRPVQTVFLLEQAMTLVADPNSADRIRRILTTLDSIESQMVDAVPQLQAESLGDLKLRGPENGKTVTDLMEREYVRWAKRLADILGIPLYPYSDRFKRRGSGNIPVSG